MKENPLRNGGSRREGRPPVSEGYWWCDYCGCKITQYGKVTFGGMGDPRHAECGEPVTFHARGVR